MLLRVLCLTATRLVHAGRGSVERYHSHHSVWHLQRVQVAEAL